MKISNLIAKLQSIQSEHGDLPIIWVYDGLTTTGENSEQIRVEENNPDMVDNETRTMLHKCLAIES